MFVYIHRYETKNVAYSYNFSMIIFLCKNGPLSKILSELINTFIPILILHSLQSPLLCPRRRGIKQMTLHLRKVFECLLIPLHHHFLDDDEVVDLMSDTQHFEHLAADGVLLVEFISEFGQLSHYLQEFSLGFGMLEIKELQLLSLLVHFGFVLGI